MTRFWLTLDQAVDFVIQCFREMRGRNLRRENPQHQNHRARQSYCSASSHHIIGIRPGEKLHEIMISAEDSRHTLEFDNHYVIVPETFTHEPLRLEKFLNGRPGKKPPEDFSYTSNNNVKWLTAADLKKVLSKQPTTRLSHRAAQRRRRRRQQRRGRPPVPKRQLAICPTAAATAATSGMARVQDITYSFDDESPEGPSCTLPYFLSKIALYATAETAPVMAFAARWLAKGSTTPNRDSSRCRQDNC